MRSFATLIALAAPTLLAGCVGAFVPIQTVETTGIKMVEAAAGVAVISAEKAARMQDLGSVVGYSCKNKIWDPAATTDAATYQAKLTAAQRGATAITGLECSEGAVSLIRNCWQSFSCTATALK